MKDIWKYVSLFLVAIVLSTCTFLEDNESFRKVTYKVESRGVPCTLLISYDDESGRQVDVSWKNEWKQTVRLPTGKIANVNVTAVIDLKEYYKMPASFFLEDGEEKLPPVPINVKISQRGRQVLCSGYGTLCTSMDDLEAISF